MPAGPAPHPSIPHPAQHPREEGLCLSAGPPRAVDLRPSLWDPGTVVGAAADSQVISEQRANAPGKEACRDPGLVHTGGVPEAHPPAHRPSVRRAALHRAGLAHIPHGPTTATSTGPRSMWPLASPGPARLAHSRASHTPHGRPQTHSSGIKPGGGGAA